MSKGSAPRPIPDRKKFDENWDRISGKKDKKSVETEITNLKSIIKILKELKRNQYHQNPFLVIH